MAHWKTPTELAKEVDSGNYSPTRYLSCEKDLTPDGGSFIVRFTEFTLFTKPSREGLGRFLIFQPQNLAGKEAVKTRERDLRARRLQSWLASWQKHPPDLERRADVSSMPRESRKHRDLSKAALQGLLAEQAMRAIATAQGGDLRVPPARAGQARSQQLLEVMAGAFLPGPLQSYGSAHALVGLCSEFEQVWTPVGYTRGELIGSVSLAPGERVTVEIHSWDKSTTKTESELASESELRTSEKYSQRDALTVLQEYAARQNTKVDMGLNVPLKVVTLNLGFGQVNDAQSRVNNTTENIREQTAEAANVLKVNRKMRIESSREVGRESKQTRVVENTNRCHTLNCHYFEIIANYLVSTRFRDVQPCLLIPYPRIAFTIDVVLCNEGVLRRSLLDRTFLPGFEAAHLLAVIREQKEISDRRRAERLSLIGAQLAPYAEQISDAYGVLEAAIAALDEAIEREGLGHQWEVAALLTDTQIDRIWAWHGLPILARTALRRFRHDLSEGMNAAEMIRSLNAKLEPGIPPRRVYDAFVELNERLGSWSHAQQGDGQITGVAEWHLQKDIAECDDGGLRGAVRAAKTALLALPAVDFDEFTEVPAAEEAVATKDFNRLVCHLEDNWLQYNQSMWAAESHEKRFQRFAPHQWAVSLIEHRILGFHGHRAAFPLRDTTAIFDVDLEQLIKKIRDAVKEKEPVLISQPTSGQVLEAVVGNCEACEQYIQDSRTIDLRLSSARAEQAQAEADRVRARVAAGDLSDPTPAPNRLAVDVHSGGG